jgi:hypothetical protein
MNTRKLSIFLIITNVLLFIVCLVVYDKSQSGVAKVIDLSLAASLLVFCYSYLQLEKYRSPYIKASIIICAVCAVFFILVIAGVDFSLGENVKKK